MLFDKKENKFLLPETIYENCKIDATLNVTKILNDKNDNIFLLTNESLVVYNFITKVTCKLSKDEVISDISNGINGNILIVTDKGIYSYSARGMENVIELNNESSLKIESNGTKIWIIANKFDVCEYNIIRQNFRRFFY